MTQFKNMLLVKGTVNWTGTKKATFKMIPLTNDCPFIEGIFDPEALVLGLIGKYKKNGYDMLPSLDANGDPERKKKLVKDGEIPFKLERRMMEKWNEHEILTREEIENFINMFAVNADSFDYKAFFTPVHENQKIHTIVSTTPDSPSPVEMKATVTQE